MGPSPILLSTVMLLPFGNSGMDPREAKGFGSAKKGKWRPLMLRSISSAKAPNVFFFTGQVVLTATPISTQNQEQKATHDTIGIDEGGTPNLGFVQEAVFIPADSGYKFAGVRYNRVHPFDDAAQLELYQQQPFFAMLFSIILFLGFTALVFELVNIFQPKKEVTALRRALLVHTGCMDEEIALMVSRGVPWIDFSKSYQCITMQHCCTFWCTCLWWLLSWRSCHRDVGGARTARRRAGALSTG